MNQIEVELKQQMYPENKGVTQKTAKFENDDLKERAYEDDDMEMDVLDDQPLNLPVMNNFHNNKQAAASLQSKRRNTSPYGSQVN